MGLIKSAKIRRRMNELVKMLGGEIEDPGCNFANGDGYYQLKPEAVRMFDNAFIEAVKEFEPALFHEYEKKGLLFVITNYFTGRWLDDSGSPLYGPVMVRFNVDDKFRRWGQMYYATHPGEGKDKKLGDL